MMKAAVFGIVLLVAASVTAWADCELRPQGELKVVGEKTTASSGGATSRTYELEMKLENHIACAGDEVCSCSAYIALKVGRTTQDTVQKDGACADNVMAVSKTVTVSPGARYSAGYIAGAAFTGSCHDTGALGRSSARRCGSNHVDIPPVIESATIFGNDPRDAKAPFIGWMNGLVVGKAARISFASPLAPGVSKATYVFKGAGVDVRRDSKGNAMFEDIVPTEPGVLTVTLEVSGTSPVYGKKKGATCDSTEEPWTLTSEPFLINVGTKPCPRKGGGSIGSNTACGGGK
ncbi:MAG: hypothetical protein LBT74_04550 [Acidobacteriota bacterium]|jgi:hypothetical protein|nr:hypothetical protein [Acidobacteriota bacterium]